MNERWVWSWLLFWTFIVIPLGGFLTTDHWHRWRYTGWLPRWLGTIVGLLLVGFGTLFGTYFWNELATIELRLNMTKAVAAELVNNDTIIKSVITSEENDQVPPGFRIYPRLSTATLEAALASGLFVDDGHLMAQFTQTLSILSQMNSRLEIVEYLMVNTEEGEMIKFRNLIESNEAIKVKVLTSLGDLAQLLKVKHYLDGGYAPFGYEHD